MEEHATIVTRLGIKQMSARTRRRKKDTRADTKGRVPDLAEIVGHVEDWGIKPLTVGETRETQERDLSGSR